MVVALMLSYSAYFSALSIQRNNTFHTAASDLGQMDQALWNTLHGHLLEDTRPDGHQAPRLTDHVEPIFFAISLSYLAFDGIESILVLQSIALALGALPLYWIARRRLKSEMAAAAFAALYLLFPALEAANLAEFHAVTFAPASLLFAINYADERAWKRFALCALVALAVKEDIALLVLAMGIWFAVRDVLQAQGFKLLEPRTWPLKRINVYPAALAAVSALWFALVLIVIVPHFNPQQRSVYTGRYDGLSSNPVELALALPRLILGIFVPEKIGYVVGLLASVGFVGLLDPIGLLLGAPSLLLNLLSSYPAQYSGTYHYSAPVAPYFVLAAIGGTAAGTDWLARRFGVTRRGAQAAVIIPVFAVALTYHVLEGYTPIGGEFVWPQMTAHQQLFSRFAAEIPPDARVTTTATLFPHLSHRRYLYRFPVITNTQYIMLDVAQAATTNPVDYRENYLHALDEGFGVKDAADGYILLERGLMQKELPEAFYTFLLATPDRKPDHPVVVDFEDKIRFLGYDVRQDDWHRVYLRTYWTHLPGFDDNNYALFPFFPDDKGAPRQDALLPDLLVHFWYPTARWKEGQVVVADTVPVDVGATARIGVGVYFGASWASPERRLTPHTAAAVSDDGTFALVGTIARERTGYRVNVSP